MPRATRPKQWIEETTLRAAQYLRVSTTQQKYTIENQSAAIAAYATRRRIDIVRTYADMRSGVRIAGRDGLQKLIEDVQRGGADYNCILVYDVSRWGRFQDVDESAYYEFICTRAGINIHYCADEFENDGSFASIMLKTNKRVAAADYSRQLSKKVFLGQCRVTTLGRWRGGTAPFGLRRMLVGENGKPKMALKLGQRKNLKTEHTILVPGPKSEVAIVREIFTKFANRKKSRTEIANELNARGIRNARRKPWSSLTISNMLKNEIYLGHIIYNKRSMKLGERLVRNPRDRWIRYDGAFKPIVPPKLFARAQQTFVDCVKGRKCTDKEMLSELTALWRKKGHLSIKVIQASSDARNVSTYCKRFGGSLVEAYDRIGFKLHSRYRFREVAASIDAAVSAVAKQIIGSMGQRGRKVGFFPELYMLNVEQGLTVAMCVARNVSDGTGQRSRRWEIRRLKFRRADLALVVRMNSSNSKVLDYFVLPTSVLPRSRDNRMRITERHFGAFCYDDLNGVVKAITDRLGLARSARVLSTAKPEPRLHAVEDRALRPS